MKRIISILLSVVMLCSVALSVPFTAYAHENDIASTQYGYCDGFKYEVLSDNTARIVEYYGSDYDVSIPKKLDGYTVTEIGAKAFQYCNIIDSVTIPNTVKTIGDGAFLSCKYMYKITIPSSVTKIGKEAFRECRSLFKVTLPDSLTEISYATFAYCVSLEKVNIPASVKKIGQEAFMQTAITAITIPDSVSVIDSFTFCSCDNLTEIVIPSSVTTIGTDAFYGCVNLEKITIPESVTTIKGHAFHDTMWFDSLDDGPVYINDILYFYKGDTVSDKVIKVKNGTRSISPHAFSELPNLTQVVLPDSVTDIGKDAFSFCPDLTKVNIPSGVTTINDGTFACCTAMSEITLPETVTSIGDLVFSNCKNLTKIVIPKSVTSINDNAFYNCSKLTIYGSNDSYAKTYAQKKGIKFQTYLSTPVITKAEVNNSGVKLSWNKVSGGDKYSYRVFVKNGSSWKSIATVSGSTNTYVDKTATPSATYTYTLRCVDSNNKYMSDYSKSGFTIRYLETPQISSFENTSDGTVISWDPIDNAHNYRIYIKKDGSWSKLADTSQTSYTHTSLEYGESNTYTVRCLSEDSKTLESGYNSTGHTNTYDYREAIRVYLDEENDAQLSSTNDRLNYIFYAPSDGNYEFFSSSDFDLFVTVKDNNGNVVTTDDDSNGGGDFKATFYMNAGDVFSFEVKAYNIFHDGRFSVYIKRAKNPVTELKILSLPYKLEYNYNEAMYDIDYTGLKLEATLQDGSKIEWTYGSDANNINGEELVLGVEYYPSYATVNIKCDTATVSFDLAIVKPGITSIELVNPQTLYLYENSVGYYDYEKDYFHYYYERPVFEVLITYLDGTQVLTDTSKMVDYNEFYFYDNQYTDHFVLGENTATISFSGLETQYNITILETPVETHEILTNPIRKYNKYDESNISYNEYTDTYTLHTLDLSDLSFTLYFKDGSEKTYTYADIDTTTMTIDGERYYANPTQIQDGGEYWVSINYKGYDIYYRAYVSGTRLMFGDADADGVMSILDATAIQLHLSQMKEIDSELYPICDVDGDGCMSIMDATHIQLSLSGQL